MRRDAIVTYFTDDLLISQRVFYSAYNARLLPRYISQELTTVVISTRFIARARRVTRPGLLTFARQDALLISDAIRRKSLRPYARTVVPFLAGKDAGRDTLCFKRSAPSASASAPRRKPVFNLAHVSSSPARYRNNIILKSRDYLEELLSRVTARYYARDELSLCREIS